MSDYSVVIQAGLKVYLLEELSNEFVESDYEYVTWPNSPAPITINNGKSAIKQILQYHTNGLDVRIAPITTKSTQVHYEIFQVSSSENPIHVIDPYMPCQHLVYDTMENFEQMLLQELKDRGINVF